jgi:hypothetical protein
VEQAVVGLAAMVILQAVLERMLLMEQEAAVVVVLGVQGRAVKAAPVSSS